MANRRKLRVELRKNRSARRRSGDLTRRVAGDLDAAADLAAGERLSGKGDLTRKRTVVVEQAEPRALDGRLDGLTVEPAPAGTLRGRVLHVQGLESVVLHPDGSTVRCMTRRLLKTLSTDQRHPVAAGDWVQFRGAGRDGVIHAIEPRRNSLCRSSRGRRHVIVAAEASGIRPFVCLNKADLVPTASLVPLAGVYARMGYAVVLCSAATGLGIDRLRSELDGRVTAVVGQSGVGKSSILNALAPDLGLRVGEVSRDNDKGRHTTTTARLIPHGRGGAFVDTPGVRQFQLWQLVPAEVPAAFRDLRPIANRCRFPDCTHTHETDCAVKQAVADGLLDTRRWESCCHLTASSGPDGDGLEGDA